MKHLFNYHKLTSEKATIAEGHTTAHLYEKYELLQPVLIYGWDIDFLLKKVYIKCVLRELH